MQTSYLELEEQAAQLLKQAEELRLQERAAVIQEVSAKINQYGITAAELALNQVNSRSAVPAPAKFRGPKGELWAGGRGRKPDWVRKALDSGESLDQFEIRLN